MTRQSFLKRFISPALPVLAVMTISYAGYHLSSGIDNLRVNYLLSTVFGAGYFISIALGAIYVYPAAYFRGAGLAERILTCCITPLAWATGGVATLLESHPPLECIYWYLNPLNIWLAMFLALEMGLAEIFCRRAMKKCGADIRVASPGAIAVVIISLALAIGSYAWGEGENIYVMFLAGYRLLFGTGV